MKENEINSQNHWSEDKEFVAELDERLRRYDAGIDPGFSIEEAKSTLNKMKAAYFSGKKISK